MIKWMKSCSLPHTRAFETPVLTKDLLEQIEHLFLLVIHLIIFLIITIYLLLLLFYCFAPNHRAKFLVCVFKMTGHGWAMFTYQDVSSKHDLIFWAENIHQCITTVYNAHEWNIILYNIIPREMKLDFVFLEEEQGHWSRTTKYSCRQRTVCVHPLN